METEQLRCGDRVFDVVRFSEKLIPEFIYLFNLSFNKKISRDFVSRKYATEGLGGSFFGYMAFDKDVPIAYYGTLPVQVVIDGRIMTAVQSADTMTHPDYRGLGLFPKLATKTYQLANSEGAKFVFGWPNQNSFHTFKHKLGWIELGRMRKFSLRVSTLPLAKLSVKIRLFRPLFIRWVNAIFTVTNEGCKPFDTERSIPLDFHYLSYKQSQGAVCVQLGETNQLVSIDHRLKIGNLPFEDNQKLKRTCSDLTRKAFLCGIDEIQIVVHPTFKHGDTLKEIGFRESDDLPLMYWPFNTEIEIKELKVTGLDYDGF